MPTRVHRLLKMLEPQHSLRSRTQVRTATKLVASQYDHNAHLDVSPATNAPSGKAITSPTTASSRSKQLRPSSTLDYRNRTGGNGGAALSPPKNRSQYDRFPRSYTTAADQHHPPESSFPPGKDLRGARSISFHPGVPSSLIRRGMGDVERQQQSHHPGNSNLGGAGRRGSASASAFDIQGRGR